LQRADGSVEALPSKVAGMAIGKGDIFRLVTAGGGGYGDPSGRREDAIGDDIANGYVTRTAATADYGTKT